MLGVAPSVFFPTRYNRNTCDHPGPRAECSSSFSFSTEIWSPPCAVSDGLTETKIMVLGWFGSLGLYSGWWFGTWILFFHILGIVIPTDFHIFQRGWNHQPVLFGRVLAFNIFHQLSAVVVAVRRCGCTDNFSPGWNPGWTLGSFYLPGNGCVSFRGPEIGGP